MSPIQSHFIVITEQTEMFHSFICARDTGNFCDDTSESCYFFVFILFRLARYVCVFLCLKLQISTLCGYFSDTRFYLFLCKHNKKR